MIPAIIMLLGALCFGAAAYHHPEQEIPLLLMAFACAAAGIAAIFL